MVEKKGIMIAIIIIIMHEAEGEDRGKKEEDIQVEGH